MWYNVNVSIIILSQILTEMILLCGSNDYWNIVRNLYGSNIIIIWLIWELCLY